MKRIKGYNVYRSGKFMGFADNRNRTTRKTWARNLIGNNTHMGEWTRERGLNPEGIEYATVFHYTYHTTIGVYVDFRPAWRSESNG